MSDEILRDMGRFEERLNSLETNMAELKTDVKAVRSAIDQAQGGYRTLMAVGGAAGVVGSGLTWLIQHLKIGG